MDTDRAARIASLSEHPAFKEFAEEVQEMHDKYANALAKTMMVTGKPFEDFDYKRGYWAGLLEAVRYPEKAMKKLERDIAKSKTEEEDSE